MGDLFNVTGQDGLVDFSNIILPNTLVQKLWQCNFAVLVDEKQPIQVDSWTDRTYMYIYLTMFTLNIKLVIIKVLTCSNNITFLPAAFLTAFRLQKNPNSHKTKKKRLKIRLLLNTVLNLI